MILMKLRALASSKPIDSDPIEDPEEVFHARYAFTVLAKRAEFPQVWSFVNMSDPYGFRLNFALLTVHEMSVQGFRSNFEQAWLETQNAFTRLSWAVVVALASRVHVRRLCTE